MRATDQPATVAYGVSTGWHPGHRTDFPAAVAHAASVSTGTVELAALNATNLPLLGAYLASDTAKAQLAAFGHVSVHGPAKALHDGWPALIAALNTLDLGPARHIVLHPDTFTDLHDALALGPRAVFENMDVRKADCRTARELDRVFEAVPAAGFCLDVAHVLTIDPSLAEGHRLLDCFGDRLAEVHVSGIHPDGRHRPTTEQDMDRFAPLLDRCAHVPWVFEAPLPARWPRRAPATA